MFAQYKMSKGHQPSIAAQEAMQIERITQARECLEMVANAEDLDMYNLDCIQAYMDANGVTLEEAQKLIEDQLLEAEVAKINMVLYTGLKNK